MDTIRKHGTLRAQYRADFEYEYEDVDGKWHSVRELGDRAGSEEPCVMVSNVQTKITQKTVVLKLKYSTLKMKNKLIHL